MALGAAYEDEAIQALANTPTVPKPAPERGFSVWKTITAAPRGIVEAAAQGMASAAEIAGGFGQVAGAYPEALGVAGPNLSADQRRQADAQRRRLLTEGVDMSSEAGDLLREAGRSYRPDPITSHAAEQVVYGFARGASKVVGGALAMGPAGVLAAGAEESMSAADDLRLQGVDLATRTKAGAVQGAGLALAALPIVGQTKLATAGLYAIGGPGGFVAQQALTREILQGAGYDQIGAQFDPFDPVGLAVATLLPAGFAAHGLRQQKLQRAAASLPDLPPRAEAVPPADPAAPPAPFPSRPSAVADAVRAYPTEAVDAARVVLLAERRAASNPGAPDSLRAMDQHEAALSRAEDQINAGEVVRVADVAPEIYRPAPLMDTRGTGQRFHGTSREIAALSDEYAMVGDNRNIYGAGFYTTDAVDIAAGYMKKGRGPAPTLYTVQEQPVKLLNMDAPLTEDLRAMLRSVVGDADYTGPDSLIDSAKTLRQWFDEFRSESRNFGLSRDDVHEVWDSLRANLEAQGFRGYEHTGGDKTGNKPHTVRIFWSPETDVIIQRSALEEFRQRLQEAADELRAAIEPSRPDAPTTTQAANPEAAAPARGAGEPPATAGAADAGRPAGVEAAGLTPEQARAAVQPLLERARQDLGEAERRLQDADKAAAPTTQPAQGAQRAADMASIRDGVAAQIMATGRHTAQEADAYARLTAEVYATQAQRLGITPGELFAQQPLRVAGETAGATLNQFAGTLSATADQHALATAKARIDKGDSPERVRQETGWLRGVDGSWRYEISDDGAAFRDSKRATPEELAAQFGREITVQPDGADLFKALFRPGTPDYAGAWGRTEEAARASVLQRMAMDRNAAAFSMDNVKAGDYHLLSEVLQHDKLFAAYPFLRNTRVRFVEGEDYRGSFNPRENLIEISLTGDRDQMLSTMLHEVQHVIQEAEGFARGGNSHNEFTDAVKHALGTLSRQAAEAVEQWKWANTDKIDAAAKAAHVARMGLLYESAQRLMSYANRESPSGVMRLIRGEMQWVYSDEFRKNEAAQDLQRDFWRIPKPSNLRKRNAFLSDMAARASQVFMSEVPADLRAQFRADGRTTKAMLAALQREAERKRKPLAPLRELEKAQRSAADVSGAHKYSTAYEVYRAMAGEVEARNTQARQSMTDAERRATSPWATTDVPPERTVVMLGGMEIQAPRRIGEQQADPMTGLALNSDGTVTVYHHTSAKNAEKIRQEGVLRSAGERDLYFTTTPETTTGYGDTAVPIRVKPERLVLDDEFPDGRQDYRVAAPSQARRVRFDGAGPGLLLQAERGTYSPDTSTIALLKAADASTFLHESGHHYLELMHRLATGPAAPTGIRADFDILLRDFGVQGASDVERLAAWGAMDLEARRAGHERFATQFERYLAEGKAPTQELQSLFDTFKAWLLRVYRSLTDAGDALTPEVRGVMDRLVADERAAEPVGAMAEAVTERGLTVPLRYRLAEAGGLTTSHTNDLTPNPAFPAELQPRDRARAASAEQIGRIENAIRPELLGESVKASDGAPIVGPDGVVESGNARTIALRRAYESGKADAYRAWLADNAERFGLTRADVEGMQRPVLVRERLGDVNRAEFARQANESAVAAMSPTEQARADAGRITDLSGLVANEDGTINTTQSADFIRQFLQQAVAPTERGAMIQADGRLSAAGMQRMRNAVFAKAYGDPEILAMLTESTDANVRNILAGMMRAAPEVAKLRDMIEAGARQNADIAGPLAQAVRLFSQLRGEGRTVQQFLAQGSMFGDGPAPGVVSMLEALQADSRAPKRVAEMIGRMVDAVNAAGDARQMGMFGDAPQGGDLVAGAAERAVMDSRLAMAADKFPDLQVQADGMDSPMPLAEFMAAAKAEAGELAADAPLMQVAAECALLNGRG